MTAEEYRNYLETDFDDVDLKELKDIRKIRIDRNQTKEKRIAQYLRQVGNENNCVDGSCAYQRLSGIRLYPDTLPLAVY